MLDQIWPSLTIDQGKIFSEVTDFFVCEYLQNFGCERLAQTKHYKG